MAFIAKFSSVSLLLMLSVFFCGCPSGQQGNIDEQALSEAETDIAEKGSLEAKVTQAKNMLYLIPSPIETAMLLHKAGAEYDSDIVNAPQNVSKYDTKRSKSINLGIYGADLSYANMFEQSQEAMFIVSAAKKLAEGIGVMKAFDQSTMDRMEQNINDRDSMLHIISDVYWIADAYLKENENSTTAALVVVGGWIEGLWIAVSVAKNNTENQDVRKRIAEQKYALDNLIGLVSNYDEDEDIKYILKDLSDLKVTYDKLEIVKSKSDHSTDPETGIMTIGGIKEVKMTEEQFTEIAEKVISIRTKYIE
ncbi:MAG: hypothetical protein COA57_00815 [Flavobacteriales bacterium]|nr:MAG: hypothetical protein COA57_00815 [Flavobacteriales bacterium]